MKKVSFPVLMALGLTAQVSFAATVFTENFDYADGLLVGASGSPWTNHSGTAGQVNVASNAATTDSVFAARYHMPVHAATWTRSQ